MTTVTSDVSSSEDVSKENGSTKSGEEEATKPIYRTDDGGDETPDTDKEEEDYKRRKADAKNKGIKIVQRASFKRNKSDRHYDQYPWPISVICRLLGIDMAPMHLPWHRRIETMTVLAWMSTFLFMGWFATYVLYYLFFYTQYWWITLCYICWYIPDRNISNRGGRRSNWMRKWGIWKHYRNFFPVRLIKTAELSGDHNYIMGYHPHGLLCAGAFSSFATEGTDFSKVFPGITPHLLTLEILFLLPLYRELLLLSGACSATKASMDHLLGKEGSGRALCLVIGGAPEALDCHPGQVILHLDRRIGFAKMALRHGASLVPMFAFGENDVYDQIANPEGSKLRGIQDALQKIFHIPPCLFMGRGIFQYSLGIVPFRKPIYVVVGAPIHVDPVKKPTIEQILDLHGRYKDALISLYDDYKHTYARNPELPIQFI